MICGCCHRFATTGKYWYDDTDFGSLYLYERYPEDVRVICLYCDYACSDDECFRPKTLNRDGTCNHVIGRILKFELEEKYCITCEELEEDLNTIKRKDNYDLGFE